MRSLTATGAAVVTVGVVVLAGTAAWFLWDGGDGAAPGAGETAAESSPANVTHAGVRSMPRGRAAEEPPIADAEADLERTWAAALAQHKEGKPVEALTTIATGRRDRPDWFAEATRAPIVRAM